MLPEAPIRPAAQGDSEPKVMGILGSYRMTT